MVRTAPVRSPFLVAAFSLALSCAHDTYEVTVTNLSYMQPFSYILLVAHNEDIQIFEKGAASTEDFRELAETGFTTSLNATLMEEVNECCLCGLEVASAELFPGDAQTLTLSVDTDVCSDGAYFSLASMLVNTNDGFFGIDSMSVANKTFPITIDLPALDAGTETNNELCSHIPGPACEDPTVNLQTEESEGFIHTHRGFRGVGELPAAFLDWRNPVAHVFITT